MNTKEYFYLSDEELMHLIDLSEADGLLPAPKQLKSAILTAAARAPRPLTRVEKRIQFLAYCARVGVACAACLTMLFTVRPGELRFQKTDAPAEPSGAKLSAFSEQVDEHVQDINQALSDFFYNFGGTSHE